MKRLILPIILILILCGCGEGRVTLTRYALDTEINVTVNESDEAAARAALVMCEGYEKVFSRTDENSLLARKNAGETVENAELDELTRTALGFCEKSRGAFDVTVAPLSDLWGFGSKNYLPEAGEIASALEAVDYKRIDAQTLDFNGAEVDLGAIAKGYIADKMCGHLRDAGVKTAILDLGGNVALIGGPYRVGVADPSGGIFGVCECADCAVVTSGIYERSFEADGRLYHHILDTKSGCPVENSFASVTIAAPDSTTADALSTTVFALGEDEGLAFLNEYFPSVGVLFIRRDGSYFANDIMIDAYNFSTAS